MSGTHGQPDLSGGFAAACLQALPTPVVALDAGDRITFANPAAEQFFATSARGLARLGLAEIVPLSSPLTKLIARARAGAVLVSESGVTAGTPRTGGTRPVDVQAAPIPEQPGTVLMMCWSSTVAAQIDRHITSHNAARAVTGMAETLAHEIRNPLSGIRGAAQLLEPAVSQPDRALTQLICAETDRIRDLIDQMEVFSDQRPLARAPVNIHTVLNYVRALADSGFARDVEIKEIYDPSLPLVHGHRDQLVQVVLNLVKNAVEAMEAGGGGGAITLQTAYRPGVRLNVPGTGERVSLPLEMQVRNDGPPIPHTLMDQLFEPFVTTRANGRGLGLALVSKIVRAHGGIVDCESGPGSTVFRVLLPMAGDEGVNDE